MIIKLGLRNIFRNKRRTIITCLIMGLGLTALIFSDAFLRGLNQNMVSSVTESFIGDGQIHRNDFLKTREIEKTINNSEDVLKNLLQHKKIKDASARSLANGMIASPGDVLPVVLYGIDPVAESRITSLKRTIIRGKYLEGENTDQILIGEKLAQFLGTDIGDKVVVTTAQAQTGQLSQELFRISGIFKMKNKEMDRSMAFIDLKKSQALMGIGGSFHEIVFKFKNKNDITAPPEGFLRQFSSNDNLAQSWKKLVPAIDAGIELTNYSLYIGSAILFAIIALSTMNTLFMSIYERMYEFAIMKAIGTRSWFIFRMIIAEALTLSLVSAICGALLGGALSLLFSWTGIHHLTDVEYLGTTILHPIRPIITPNQYIIYPLSIILFSCISALYPALTAAKIVPTEAMKRD